MGRVANVHIPTTVDGKRVWLKPNDPVDLAKLPKKARDKLVASGGVREEGMPLPVVGKGLRTPGPKAGDELDESSLAESVSKIKEKGRRA